jgi:hypothetical protein
MLMDMIVASKDIYESQIKKLEQETGDKIDVSYEDMREFHKKKEHTLEIPIHRFVISEIEIFDKILPLFFARKWTFIMSNKEVGEFISSDHPVSLFSIKPNSHNSVGYGTKDTEVVFPLSRYIAMLGSFNDSCPQFMHADKKIVAIINSRTLSFAKDQIYSGNEDLYCMNRNFSSIITYRQLMNFKQ